VSDERLSVTPAGVALAPLASIPDGGARNFVLHMRAGRFHGFAVRKGEEVYGYVDRCPHMGLPLAQTLDDYLSPSGEVIACSWHGAVFEIESGRCLGGPCAGQGLTRWPVTVVDGVVVTA
jgi:nitrite reductase/ring-hydroxylating ferredoxin subunit